MPTDSEPASLSPTVQRIFQTLKDRILTGEYPDGQWLPTERALAEEFGVSRILIRPAVKELERERLIACEAHRRPLVRRDDGSMKTAVRNVALWIWPQHAWPGSALLIRGIQSALGEDFRLVLGNTNGGTWDQQPAAEARFLANLSRDPDIAGAILSYVGGATNVPLLQELRAAGIPVVFVDHLPPDGFAADYVGINNRRAAEQAVKHLIALGHRSIAHLSNFDTLSTITERQEGYRRALAVAGISFRPELVKRDPGPPGDDPLKGCEELVAEWMALPDPPTAVFAVHDVAAYRLIAALRASGLRVPEDISVVGFDGMERWMPTPPFITTIYQPFEDIGAGAMELLEERITTGTTEPFRHVILDARLSVHRSTLPNPRADRATPEYSPHKRIDKHGI